MNAIVKNVNPADAAREAIRRLAMDRIAPTPENFARAYREAAGEASAEVAAATGAASNPKEGAAAEAAAAAAKSAGDWPRLMQRLLGQLDASSPQWTRARKLGAVDHVLRSAGGDTGRTHEKLERLISAWAQGTGAAAEKVAAPSSVEPGAEGIHPPTILAPVMPAGITAERPLSAPMATSPGWRELALAALDGYASLAQRQGDASPTVDRFSNLRAQLQMPNFQPGETELVELQAACAGYRADLLREAAIRERLKVLLRLVCDNLNLFAEDDAWVQSQVARIGQLLDAPLDEHVLTEAEDSLRAAAHRQAELKTNLAEARGALKEMLAILIDRLSAVAASTGEYYCRIDESAGQIRSANDLASLSKVVASLLDDTGNMRDGMQRTHSELNAARDKAKTFEQRVQALERELVEVSTLIRTDPLTLVLNRRGLDDVFTVEQARAERDDITLSVALLDIDNFKRLNDSLGHQIGDLALRHLSGLVRGALRPTDTVARFGGEEFVILLPSSSAEMAVMVLTRLQRLLTRALFLHNDEKILITFSAGITEYLKGETRESAIGRADAALYVAKSAGKNRVVVG